MREKSPVVFHTISVIVIFIVLLICIVLSFLHHEYLIALTMMLIIFMLSTGISIVNPNEAVVISFLGRYIGSERKVGLFMALPFTKRTNVSLKIQTKEYHVTDVKNKGKLVIIYRIVDSAKAIFDIDNYDNYLNTQVELAISRMVEEGVIPVVETVNEQLKILQNRLEIAGIEAIEMNIIPSLKIEK